MKLSLKRILVPFFAILQAISHAAAFEWTVREQEALEGLRIAHQFCGGTLTFDRVEEAEALAISGRPSSALEILEEWSEEWLPTYEMCFLPSENPAETLINILLLDIFFVIDPVLTLEELKSLAQSPDGYEVVPPDQLPGAVDWFVTLALVDINLPVLSTEMLDACVEDLQNQRRRQLAPGAPQQPTAVQKKDARETLKTVAKAAKAKLTGAETDKEELAGAKKGEVKEEATKEVSFACDFKPGEVDLNLVESFGIGFFYSSPMFEDLLVTTMAALKFTNIFDEDKPTGLRFDAEVEVVKANGWDATGVIRAEVDDVRDWTGGYSVFFGFRIRFP